MKSISPPALPSKPRAAWAAPPEPLSHRIKSGVPFPTNMPAMQHAIRAKLPGCLKLPSILEQPRRQPQECETPGFRASHPRRSHTTMHGWGGTQALAFQSEAGCVRFTCKNRRWRRNAVTRKRSNDSAHAVFGLSRKYFDVVFKYTTVTSLKWETVQKLQHRMLA